MHAGITKRCSTLHLPTLHVKQFLLYRLTSCFSALCLLRSDLINAKIEETKYETQNIRATLSRRRNGSLPIHQGIQYTNLISNAFAHRRG